MSTDMSTDEKQEAVRDAIAGAEIGEPEVKPKIYIFQDGDCGKFGVVGVAVAEDGESLASHLSSCTGWLRHDMGLGSEWKHDTYREKYPNGFELVYLDAGDPKLDDVYAANKKFYADNPAALEARHDN